MSVDQSIQVKLAVGDRTLITSGVIHLSGQNQIDFQVLDLKFVFEFKSDEGDSRYSGELKSEKLHLCIFNHNNSLGEGVLEPIEIATIGGKRLSVTYFVSTLDVKEQKRRFEYAFYLGGDK